MTTMANVPVGRGFITWDEQFFFSNLGRTSVEANWHENEKSTHPSSRHTIIYVDERAGLLHPPRGNTR